MIVYKCPCGEVYKAADGQAGTVVKCTECGRHLIVPERKDKTDELPHTVTYKCSCGRMYKINSPKGARRIQCPVCEAWGTLTPDA
jgi:DNA-directed RNA polymerase subunit RPC12/RpoP